jgi:hypothetical protein
MQHPKQKAAIASREGIFIVSFVPTPDAPPLHVVEFDQQEDQTDGQED